MNRMIRLLACAVLLSYPTRAETTAQVGREPSEGRSDSQVERAASGRVDPEIGMVWIGDSNTAPADLEAGQTTFGRVVSEGIPSLREINKGCPGATTWDWLPERQRMHKNCYMNAALRRMHNAVGRNTDVSGLVFHVQLGLNDISGIEEAECGGRPWLTKSAGCRTSVEDYRRNLSSLIEDLTALYPGSIILLSTPPNPPMVDGPMDRTRLEGFRATVGELVRQLDAVCFGIDFWTLVPPQSFYFGPHFDQPAHHRAGLALVARIEALGLVDLLRERAMTRRDEAPGETSSSRARAAQHAWQERCNEVPASMRKASSPPDP
jgi:hypothetical protein